MIPAAEQIEIAVDLLKNREKVVIDDETSELREAMGASTAMSAGLNFPLTPQEERAYLLGLETARVILTQEPQVELAGIDPKSLL